MPAQTRHYQSLLPEHTAAAGRLLSDVQALRMLSDQLVVGDFYDTGSWRERFRAYYQDVLIGRDELEAECPAVNAAGLRRRSPIAWTLDQARRAMEFAAIEFAAAFGEPIETEVYGS